MKFSLLKEGKLIPSNPLLRRCEFLLILFAIAFTLLIFWGTIANGKEQESPAFGLRSNSNFELEKQQKEGDLKIWQAHREFLQKGIWEKSQNELEKLYQWKLNQGIRNHYYYAIALARECEQLPKDAIEDITPILLTYAEKMAPDYSATYYARAAWLWTQQPNSLGNFASAAWYWLQGGYYSYANLEESLPHYANIIYWLLFSFLFALGGFSLSLLLRYHAFFRHHIQHFVKPELNRTFLMIFAGLLLFLPLALGMGWFGLFLVWLLVFWAYGTRADRTISLLLLVLLLIFPSAVRISSSFVASMTENGVTEILRANNGIWSQELYRQLLTLQEQSPEDCDFLQAVSLVEKRMGKFAEAEQHLRAWIQLEPKAAAAYNNLGNVYLATNRVDQAVGAYQRAIQLDGTRTESYYNLGQAYLLNLLLNEAESEFRRAKELRPQLISFYTGISSKNPNRMAIDQTIDPFHLWRRVFGGTQQEETLTSKFWAFLGTVWPLKFEETIGVVLLALLGFVHWGIRRRPLIRRCERCGRLICSRCSRSMVIGNQCSQCANAFSKKASSDPQLMKDKRLAVAKYQLRQHALSRWLSLVFPGAGHLHRGHIKEGFLYFFLGALFLTKVLFWNGWIPDPMDLKVASSIPWVILYLYFFVVFYIWVQVRMWRILKKEVKFYFRPAE